MTDAGAVEVLRVSLKGQYHASLAMLRQAIEGCPDELWYRHDQVNACWQTAYHTLFFAHLYLQTSPAAFRPWRHHQGNVQHEDGISGPADPSSTLPLIPAPYSRDRVLEYCDFCDAMVDSAIDGFDLLSPESGFHWYPTSKLEHQIVNIRHIQLGAAHLAARLRTVLDIGVTWVGTARPREAPLA